MFAIFAFQILSCNPNIIPLQVSFQKLFDSEVKNWKKEESDFYQMIQNKSHFIITIETTEGIKFGCYIEKLIDEENKYIEDSKAFIIKDELLNYPSSVVSLALIKAYEFVAGTGKDFEKKHIDYISEKNVFCNIKTFPF